MTDCIDYVDPVAVPPAPKLRPLLSTAADWKAFVTRVSFRNLVGDFSVEVIDAEAPGGAMLMLTRWVVDFTDRRTKPIKTLHLPRYLINERAAFLFILERVSGHLAHEAAENMTLDGVAIANPHR